MAWKVVWTKPTIGSSGTVQRIFETKVEALEAMKMKPYSGFDEVTMVMCDLDGRLKSYTCPTCGSSDGFSLYEGLWECNICECLVYD